MRFTLGKLNPISLRTGLALTAAAGLAASGLALASSAGAATTSHGLKTAHSCATSKKAGMMACQAVKVTSGVSALAKSAGAVNPKAAPSGYGPADLRSAYALPSSGGSGATVAIVDAYDNPNAEQDLATYRSTYGLSACSTANGCFKKVGQSGTSSLPTADAGWAEEISLDLDMVSATCPQCHILLVEADSASMDDLGASVNTAVSLGAKYVSNSYGGGESSSDSSVRQLSTSTTRAWRSPSARATSGYGAEYPAGLEVRHRGRRHLAEQGLHQPRLDRTSVWSGTGSGCSAYDTKPSWQQDAGCANRIGGGRLRRGRPGHRCRGLRHLRRRQRLGGVRRHQRFLADHRLGVRTGGHALQRFGTRRPSRTRTPSSLNDVTSGSNGSCSGSYLCTGEAGYDGPTGLGTPNGVSAFAG